VIAATNRRRRAGQRGKLREDLHYRLKSFDHAAACASGSDVALWPLILEG